MANTTISIAPAKTVFKYGSLYYYTTSKSTEPHESPQDKMITNGLKIGHKFFVCHETRNPNEKARPYKSYASYASESEFIKHVPSESKEQHHFYELWQENQKGCPIFDIEWELIGDDNIERREEEAHTKLCDIHSEVCLLISELVSGVDPTKITLPIISTDSRHTKRDGISVWKESFHFYYKSVEISNNHTDMLMFYDLLGQKLLDPDKGQRFVFTAVSGEIKPIVDFNIATRNRIFRMIFSGKASDTGNTYLIPIDNDFLRNNEKKFNRQKVVSPPWEKNDGSWSELMRLYCATVPSLDSMYSVSIVLSNEILVEGLKKQGIFLDATTRTAKRARATRLNLIERLRRDGEGRDNGAMLKHVKTRKSDDELNHDHEGEDDEAEIKEDRVTLGRIARIMCNVINKVDASLGAEVHNVSLNGCISMWTRSKWCRYKGSESCPAEHNQNFVRLIGYIRLPYPLITYSCQDKFDCHPKIAAHPIKMVIDESEWDKVDYKDLVTKSMEGVVVKPNTMMWMFKFTPDDEKIE